MIAAFLPNIQLCHWIWEPNVDQMDSIGLDLKSIVTTHALLVKVWLCIKSLFPFLKVSCEQGVQIVDHKCTYHLVEEGTCLLQQLRHFGCRIGL